MNFVPFALIWLTGVSSLSGQTGQHPQDEIAHSAETLWVKLEPEAAGAVFSMPQNPKYSETTFDEVVAQPLVVHQYRTTVNQGTASFVFVYNDLAAKMDTPKIIRDTLDGAIKGANARVLGTLKSVKNIRHKKYRGREFVYEAELNGVPYRFSTKIVLVNQRLYQMILVMTHEAYEEAMVRKYFDSFAIGAKEEDLPPKPRKSPPK